jgi:acetyl-CoA carboxylase carboxyltransferase component
MATIRHGASAMSALYHATVPIFTVVVRRAFGVAGGAFADSEDGRGTRVAWFVLSFIQHYYHQHELFY